MAPRDLQRFLHFSWNAARYALGPLAAMLIPWVLAGFVRSLRDGVVHMRTYAKSQKVLNLERDPRFAALVETGDRYVELRGVQLSGTVALLDDVDLICDVFAALMVKYEGLDPEHIDSVRTAYRDRAPKQRVLRLDVTRTVSWDHAKLAAASGATE